MECLSCLQHLQDTMCLVLAVITAALPQPPPQYLTLHLPTPHAPDWDSGKQTEMACREPSLQVG